MPTKEEVKSLSDTDLCRLVHEIIAGPWDETQCRVCGWPMTTGRLSELCQMAYCTPDRCCVCPVPAVHADAPPDYTAADCSWIGAVLNYISQRWQWEIGYDQGGWGEVKIYRMLSENDEDFTTFRTTFEHVAKLPRAWCECVALVGGK